MGQLHLSSVLCCACGLPMVVEWVGYWFGLDVPRHASCDQFARRWAEDPDQFIPAMPLNEAGEVPLSYFFPDKS